MHFIKPDAEGRSSVLSNRLRFGRVGLNGEMNLRILRYSGVKNLLPIGSSHSSQEGSLKVRQFLCRLVSGAGESLS